MLIGLGMDLAAVSHWQAALANPATVAIEGTFTAAERAYAHSTAGAPAEHLAARFAAKEAFIKALGGARRPQPPLTARLDPRTVEVVRDPHGRPALALHGEAKAIADALGVRRTWVSLTHTEGTAGAVVALEG